jgi:hypothetical protein
MAGGKAEHEEVVAEREEEEGRVEDADAEEAEGAGLVREAEEVVEEVFQDFAGRKYRRLGRKGIGEGW